MTKTKAHIPTSRYASRAESRPYAFNRQSVQQARKAPGGPEMVFSTPYRYFEEVKDLPTRPVLADDLQHHSVSRYTALSEVKKNNRAAEIALATGEKMATLGAMVAGFDYPKNEFAAAWKKVLFLQFHDSLAGSALPPHYAMARQGHGYALEVATQAISQFRVLENGPLRSTLRVRTRYGASALQMDWMLYAGARTLEARVALDWHENLKILKFSFPVDVENPRATYEIPYGYKVRKDFCLVLYPYRFSNSLSFRVCARLTGISVCLRSCILSW